MQVEDHPVDYAKFEGVIPEGEYGGGTVMVWDYGTYKPEETDDAEAALRKGDFKFTLDGEKLKGSWVLVRTRNRQWLLIKHRDYYTTEEEVTELAPVSILTRRSLAEIAEDEGGNVTKAATGDPKKIPRRTGVKRRKKGAKAKVWHSNKASLVTGVGREYFSRKGAKAQRHKGTKKSIRSAAALSAFAGDIFRRHQRRPR